MLLRNPGQQFPKSPDSALVKFFGGGLAAEPQRFQGLRIDRLVGRDEFQQVAATHATEVLGGRIWRRAAANAAQTKRILSGSRGHCLSYRKGILRIPSFFLLIRKTGSTEVTK